MAEELNDGHYHEVLDRLHIVSSIIDTHLLEHPVFDHSENDEIKNLVKDALSLLGDAYQLVGTKF